MKLLKIALVCAFTALAIPAQAATVTLDLTDNVPDFADASIDNGDTSSAGDFSVTFQNVRTNTGPSGRVSAKGIVFDRLPPPLSSVGVISVDLIFSIDTLIDSYDIGFPSFGNAVFLLRGPNGVSGLNPFEPAGTLVFDMGTIPVFLAGETYTLTHRANGGGISAFGLSSPPSPAVVPLPASLPLILVGFGAIAVLRRRS